MRLAFSDEDRRARDLFVQWAHELGCQVRIDAMGNLFARREGRQPRLAPVLTGSHVDSQPAGGKYDGAYGVVAGLEVLRTLDDHGLSPNAPSSRAGTFQHRISPFGAPQYWKSWICNWRIASPPSPPSCNWITSCSRVLV